MIAKPDDYFNREHALHHEISDSERSALSLSLESHSSIAWTCRNEQSSMNERLINVAPEVVLITVHMRMAIVRPDELSH